ncbi:MAG: citrate/2-methylcitrate synthase [Gammaproteobacteria bacterium]
MSGAGNVADAPEFDCSISRVAPGAINVRGYDLCEMMRQASASEASFLVLTGRRPTRGELRVFDAMLVANADHGLVSTLVIAARYVMTGAASLPAAMAAGVLSFGPYTGTAGLIADLLIELGLSIDPREAANAVPPDDAAIDAAIAARRARREPVPGLGHPIHRERDPRTDTLRAIALECGVGGAAVELLDRVRARASRAVGRELVINVDGFMGALMLDMGFTPAQMLATNILSAIPAIAAHAIEEADGGRRLRYPRDHAASYTLPEATRAWADEPPAGERG